MSEVRQVGTHWAKLAIIIVLVSLSIGVVVPHAFGSLYPVVNLAFSSGILLILIIAWKDGWIEQTYPIYLVCIVALSVTYRVRILTFPASTFDMDPDGYATNIARLINAGHTSAMDYNFYSRASLHFVEAAITEVITDLPLVAATSISAVYVGIGVPLVAAVFVGQLRPGSHKSMVMAAGWAGIIVYTLMFSFVPIAQTTGTYLALFTILTGFIYIIGKNRAWLFLSILLMTGTIYSHKSSAIIVTFSLLGAFILISIYPDARKQEFKLTIGMLVIVMGSLTIIQQFYTTNYIAGIIFNYFGPVFGPTSVESSSTLDPTYAFDPYTFTDRILTLSSVILLAVVSAITWCVWFWRTDERRDIIFLGLVFPLAGLPIIAYPADLNLPRMIHSSEIFLIVLVAVGLFSWMIEERQSSSYISVLTIGVVLLLVVTSGLSPIVGPDYNQNFRSYLTSEEVNAKEWGIENVHRSVVTDQYYAYTTPPRLIPISARHSERGGAFSANTSIYIHDRFMSQRPPVVAYRHCISTLRSNQGLWRLTYDAGSLLEREYNNIYDSGCVSYYYK